MAPSKKDKIFAGAEAPIHFEFDDAVARVFDDMLARSVPMYEECQRLAVKIAKQYLQDGAKFYDLGCSTGTLILRLAESLPQKRDILFVGVDNSGPMLAQAHRKLKGLAPECQLIQADIEGDFALSGASVITMNYTMQFIPPPRRGAMMKKIFHALIPSGCFIFIEKIIAESEELDELFVNGHHDFKRRQGYSKLEIAKKKEALDNVLIPLKLSENINLLEKSGFNKIEIFFKWLNFAGLIAVKN